MIILCAFAWSGEAWGQEGVSYNTYTPFNGSTTFSDGDLNKITNGVFTSATTNHVTFTINNLEKFGNNRLIYPAHSEKNQDKTSTFSWSADANYSVTVTYIEAKARAYHSTTGGSGTAQFAGGSAVTCGTAQTGKGGAQTVSVTNANGLGTSNVLTMNSGNRKAQFTLHDIKYTYKVTYRRYIFKFSATAGSSTGGSAEITSTPDSKIEAAIGKTSASTTAQFTATSNSGYEFQGWGESASVSTYESTANPYTATISNNEAGTTANKTLYAIFKPVFNFSATASKINGSYGTASASVTATKVLGATPNATSASTTVTFTANPNTNCTFEGWYEDAEHTRPASADDSYKNKTFTRSVTNSTIGSTKNLTLYAWFKTNQTLSWSNAYEPNVIYEQTSVGAATATASSGLTVSYSSNTPTVASVNSSGDVTGVSVSSTAVTITASQAGNDEFNAATPITRSFTVISKYAATFEVDGFTGITPTIYVDDTPTITLKDVDSDFTFNSSDPTVVGIARSGDVITLTAFKEGTSTVTLTQPNNTTHSAAGATYNITVAKVPNNLAVSLASESAEVDGTINVTFSDQNNTGTAIVGTITSQSLSSSVNNGTDVITYSNGVITAKNAGTAKITFTQAATEKYEGFTSSTYTITVTKISNPITITLAGGSSTNIKLKYNATASLSYSSVNPASTLEVNRVSGTYSTYSNGTIRAGGSQGTDIYAITQAETYKYEAGYASFTVRVNNTDEVDGYVLYEEAEEKHTPTSFDGTYFSEHTLNGPGGVISFKAHRSVAGVTKLEVQCHDNGSWQTGDNAVMYTENLSTSYGGEITTDTIPESTKKIRFYLRVKSTLEHCIKDVKVTRKTYVRASSNKTAFGTVYTDASPKPTATFTVNYSSTNGGNINISSNNAHFVPSISSINVESNKTATSSSGTTYICGVDGTQSFTVTYNPDPNQLGEESAVITVGDLFYSQQITLTATAAKHENTLTVIGAQNLMVDDEVSNVYSSKNSTATLNYTLSRDGVITYNPSTNKITAVGAGTATLTLTQVANDYYHSVSKTVTVNVSKYDQTISWDNVLSDEDRILEVGDVLTTNTATASSGLAITYSSSNSSALEANASTGKLTANDGGANIVITATQAGNYKYNEVSITRYFTVIKRIDPTITTILSESGTNNFPIGNPDITIRCNATITESAFTITGNSEGYVSTSFANNTLTISALKEGGNVMVTLTRAQDDGFYAVNKTYTICVVKPVVILEPTVTPVFSYEEYSSVTLSRTLKSGYSTIALPFNTTVEDIVGDSYDEDEDWVAQLSVVTYNAKDGYSLYFEKKSDIVANQPYILHLGSAVNSPVFTDVSVVAAATATQYTTKGVQDASQWVLHSNYNPTFDMEGYYGVAGEKIKKGTEGSSLKAFHAYIEGPAAAGVKAAYLDDDEADGLLEVLRGEATSEEDIYDLQGRKLSRSQRGINIIRSADGSFKKVLKK